jgi:hypothetical protein
MNIDSINSSAANAIDAGNRASINSGVARLSPTVTPNASPFDTHGKGTQASAAGAGKGGIDMSMVAVALASVLGAIPMAGAALASLLSVGRS